SSDLRLQADLEHVLKCNHLIRRPDICRVGHSEHMIQRVVPIGSRRERIPDVVDHLVEYVAVRSRTADAALDKLSPLDRVTHLHLLIVTRTHTNNSTS